MPAIKRITREEMIARHENPDNDFFANAADGEIEHVVGGPSRNSPAPISIRLSQPLLERLDRIAEREHRKRSNLIQHVLWQYVHEYGKTPTIRRRNGPG